MSAPPALIILFVMESSPGDFPFRSFLTAASTSRILICSFIVCVALFLLL